MRNSSLPIIAAIIIMMMAVAACKNGNKDYKESYTAEEWYQEQDLLYGEELTLPEESASSAKVMQPSADTSGIRPVPKEDSVVVQQVDSAGNAITPPEPPRQRVRARFTGNLAEIFNDSNHFQLMHAQRLGIDPITDMRSYYHTKRPLVRVVTNEDFRVEELTHSYPYLIPEAEKLLHDIGRAFRDSVKARKGGNYRMIVTSLLRTPVTVRKLRRINRNATEQSTHQYATTFDIGYNKFDVVSGPDIANYGDLKNILAEVIADLHRQGRCMVKYEIKSPCFHITVVR
ncbi:MAG: hypothetical protein K2M31_08560 [Muribaculaceae bacterium]|nr:hypothetical protein [Muribaculaceae bacterium]